MDFTFAAVPEGKICDAESTANWSEKSLIFHPPGGLPLMLNPW